MTKLIEIEKDVKTKIIKPWLLRLGAWFFMPVSNGMGKHGVPDFVSCVPLEVTQDMVGLKIGIFVGIEAKAPGKNVSTIDKKSDVTPNQKKNLREITTSDGSASVVANDKDLAFVQWKLDRLREGVQIKEHSLKDYLRK